MLNDDVGEQIAERVHIFVQRVHSAERQLMTRESAVDTGDRH